MRNCLKACFLTMNETASEHSLFHHGAEGGKFSLFFRDWDECENRILDGGDEDVVFI